MKYLVPIVCIVCVGMGLWIVTADASADVQVQQPRLIKTVYPTDDAVVADYVVTEPPFSADAAGAQDATDAIQAALDMCYQDGGGTVFLPVGTYRLTRGLEIKPFVTLRGDWRDPDTPNPDVWGDDYGTVIVADVPSTNDLTPGLFRIGGSSGVVGITVFYPNQSAQNPLPYPFTFEVPAGAWMGSQNYMLHTIQNVTMLNSYRGIGVSRTPFQGQPGATHEMTNISGVRGTVLEIGIDMHDGADVGLIEKVSFSNRYWLEAGEAYHAPDPAALAQWTREHTTGMRLGGLEWDQFLDIYIAGYHTGIKTVDAPRIDFCGQFFNTVIENCEIALHITALDVRWGVAFTRCKISGKQAILLESGGDVILTDCILEGDYNPERLDIFRPGTSPNTFPRPRLAYKPDSDNFFNVLDTPFSADNTLNQDASDGVQRALNKAGAQGGGVVYLPAGMYRIDHKLVVPANVELRGASSIPNRDNMHSSKGTLLWVYAGKDSPAPETDPAIITLNGDKAGISGLRFFFPENHPVEGLHPYPFAIRGKGQAVYARNIGMINAHNGIDFASFPCDDHLIQRLVAVAFHKGIVVGTDSEGWVMGCHLNGNITVRTGLTNWIGPEYNFTHVISQTRETGDWITVDGARQEYVLQNFTYGSHIFFQAKNQANVLMINNASDGGDLGVSVEDGSRVTVVNFMNHRFNFLNGEAEVYGDQLLF